MSYKDVNDQISAQIATLRATDPLRFPARLNLTETTSSTPPVTLTFEADVAPWRLIDGGGQQTVKIGIDLGNVSATIGATTYTGAASLIIEGLLDVGSNNLIRISKAPTTNPVTADWSDLNARLPSIDAILLLSMLRTWVDGLWDLFGTELMKVDPTINLPNGWEWLTPRNSRAIVSEVGATTDDHQFIVVSMTGNATPPNAVTVSGSLIPQGSKIGLSMAPGPFLDNVIRTGMDKTFLRTSPDRFTVANRTLRTDDVINVPQFQIDDTHVVDATFSSVEFSIEGERLVFTSHVEFPYSENDVNAVNVAMDLRLDYGLSLSRGTITLSDNSQLADYPLIETDPGNFQISNLTIEATKTFDILMWAVSFGATLVLGIATAGYSAYRGRQAWQEAQAAPGNNAVQMAAIGGQVGAGNTAQAAAQAAGAAAAAPDQPAPPVMWGVLPRSTVLSLVGLASGWLVTGLFTMIPFWIYLTQSKHAQDLIDQSMDDAVKEILKAYQLPMAADRDIRVTSIGLNNALMIGADPLP